MQTLEISNSTLDDIKGFSDNSNLTTLTLNHCTVGRFSQTTFTNTGKIGEFHVILEQKTTITTLDGFTSSNITNLDIIDSTITTISSRAFYNLSSLNSVTITSSSRIETIGDEAFMRCTRLTSLNISGSSTVTNIGNEAFNSCTGLTILNIDDSSTVTNIGRTAFQWCDLSTTFNLTDNVTTFGDGVFERTKIRKAIIPANLTSLGTGVYSTCFSISSVDFRNNKNITSIPDFTFLDNQKLRNVVLPSQINSIGDYAFMVSSNKEIYNDGIQTINLDNISTLGESCFKNSAITSYSINNNVSNIPTSAFENCTMMTSINLTSSRPFSIGDYAFKNTKRLNGAITNFDNITTIGVSAFEESGIMGYGLYQSKSQKIQISSIGNRAFYHCKRLEWFPFFGYSIADYLHNSISIGEEAFAYANLTGVGKQVAGKNKTNKIRPEFTSIGIGAFKYSGLPKVTFDTFEANITTIPSECFQGIGSNTEYNIPDDSVYIENYSLPWTSIGSYAFEGMSKTKRGSGSTTINLNCNDSTGTNVTEIGSFAFANAKTWIDSIYMGSIKTIGNQAFYDTDIYDIRDGGNKKLYQEISIGEWAFAHTDSWNNSTASSIRSHGSECHLSILINGTKTIGDYAFYGLAGPLNGDVWNMNPVRKIMVWNNNTHPYLLNIGRFAFCNNYFLTHPNSANEGENWFPANLQWVGDSGMKNVYIADNTTFISPYGTTDFTNSQNFIRADDHAFDNHAPWEYMVSVKYLELPLYLKTIGYQAFTAQHWRNRCKQLILANGWYFPSTFNSNPVNGANTISIYFNNASFPDDQSGHDLVDSLKRNFNNNWTGKINWY